MSAVTSQCSAQVSQRATKNVMRFKGDFEEINMSKMQVRDSLSLTTSGTAVLPDSVYLSLSDC